VVIAAGAYAPFLKRTSMANLQEAGLFLDRLEGSDAVEVLTLPQETSTGNTAMAVPLLDLATSKQLMFVRAGSFRPAARTVDTSPLRFSWDTPLPAFYREQGPEKCLPVAVISSAPLDGSFRDPRLGKGPLKQVAVFHGSTGVFRYKTFVTVFRRGCLDETGQ
jgi:hypothetical protein